MKPDTSAEAVERLARHLAPLLMGTTLQGAPDTFRALAAERNAARAEAAMLRDDLNDVGRICAAIIGENERLLRAIGLNANYAQVPGDLACKHAAALAGEPGA